MRENPEVYAKGSPGIPGMDAAGVIESAGEGVERLKVGDEVMAVVTPRRPEGGAQIELLVVPAASVVPIPNGATLAQASTLPMNGLTARLALDLIKLSAGQTLAVSGGAGLLAHYMIVLAKQRNLRCAQADPSDTESARVFLDVDAHPTSGTRKGLRYRRDGSGLDGFVTLPCREREVSSPQELSDRCDCGPPCGHRVGAKHAVRAS